MQAKDYYALNLTDSQLAKLISKIELDITEQMLSLQSKAGPLEEVTIMYNEMKSEFDKLKTEHDDNKLLLEGLIRYKKNPKNDKVIRVLRTTSHNNMDFRNKRYFKWVIWSTVILEEENRFMSYDELFSGILKTYPEISNSVGGDKVRLKQLKNTMIHNFHRTTKETREKHRGRIIDYNNRIGLFEWVDAHFKSRPQYIKEFMHDRQEVEL